METWHACRQIYCSNEQYSILDLGFATFFLNRTNRSGIIRGGVIGGKEQKGRWKIDARFNKAELVKRIERAAGYRDRIRVSNYDATFFIQTIAAKLPGKTLVYLDPPYYAEGTRLYRNHYKPKDHKLVADLIQSGVCPNWIVSYDNVAPVNEAYLGCKRVTFDLNHSAHRHHFGSEVMFIAQDLLLPPIRPA
jgi:DNA adenine methylase